MTFEQFTHQFLENDYHLSRYKNAAFSAIVVGICIAITHLCEMGMLAGTFIIGAQSVTGINRQGAFRIRLSIAAKTAVILSLSALLGSITGKQLLGLQIIAGIILAFSFGWWRQLFPLNWPDIIIPSSVLFFMNYVEPGVESTAVGTMFGLVCELLLGGFIYLKRYACHTLRLPTGKEIFPNASDEDEKTILGLKGYLVLYSIELSLLLATGFVFMYYSSYQHAYWLPLTIIIVLKVGRHGTYRRVAERTLGTLAGCFLASILLYFHLSEWVYPVCMVACIFIWLCFLRYQYAVGTVFITAFVLLLLSENHRFSFELAAERILFTILAGVLVLISSRIFLAKGRRQ